MTKLKYGNTNTFFIPGSCGVLLVDTDYAGTLPAFYRAIKQSGIRVKDIAYVMATHFHPDHSGLIGELMKQGVRLLLMDTQKDLIHFSDPIFARDHIPFVPIDASQATILSCGESRQFLFRMGISGEILCTPSHSADSVSLILDSGDCFVGDLEPLSFLDAYENNPELKRDWETILSFHPIRVFYSHAPEETMERNG